jgi:hypothetical protein
LAILGDPIGWSAGPTPKAYPVAFLGKPGVARNRHGCNDTFQGEQSERSLKMVGLIVVRATWDQEANVWTAESSDLPGLITEAASLNDLDEKLPGLIQDLLDLDDDDDRNIDIPVEVIASFSTRVRVRASTA